MDGIPQHILALNDQDLKNKLIENGLSAPILSPSIRKICQRKLAKKLGVYQSPSDDEQEETNSSGGLKHLIIEKGREILYKLVCIFMANHVNIVLV